ncbi:hypothetical protein FLONG3_5073 [Fusarium longipes]|uniref:Uncharacterized protein n=1 Tax=Fusarium longipes TaxID=694270 RepID=A0A395SXW8_9HYPO|nr:hypothetical protein FLONG3_5073 [Fusarium longipes]
MRFAITTISTILVGAASAAVAKYEAGTEVQGFKLPEGLTDGFYVAYFDDAGNEVHEMVNVPISSGAMSGLPLSTSTIGNDEGKLHARAAELYCGCGFKMNTRDCDAAVEDLKVQSDRCYADKKKCNHLIDRKMSWYSIRGSVVAFACNWFWEPVAMGRRDYLTDVMARITKNCGLYVPGTYTSSEGGVPYYGYMNYRAGLDFCMDSDSSNRPRC